MSAQKSSSDSSPNKPIPVIPAPASVLPRQFKEIPVDGDRLNTAKREATRSEGLAERPGEDPMRDRGMPAYEPVRKTPSPETNPET
jgi:hypothetical protein